MKSPSNFEGLVLGCMDSYDSNQILILLDFWRFAILCTAQIAKFLLNLSWKRITILAVLNNLFKIIHSKFAFFKSKLRFFVKILMKFCRNFTNMLRMSRIFNFLKKRTKFFEKSVKIKNFGNVQIIQKIIQHYSVVSLTPVRYLFKQALLPFAQVQLK